MRKKFRYVSVEDLELFEIAVDYVRFFDDSVLNFWKCNADVITSGHWENVVNEEKRKFFIEAENSPEFFDEEFFASVKTSDIFKLFEQAEHAIWVFKMRGTFSKASKKALEKIEKISCPMRRGLIEEIVKKASEKIEKLSFVDKTTKLTNNSSEPVVQKVVEKQSGFSRYIETIKAKKHVLFSAGALLAVIWTMFFFKHH